jgi:hypothetical protein
VLLEFGGERLRMAHMSSFPSHTSWVFRTRFSAAANAPPLTEDETNAPTVTARINIAVRLTTDPVTPLSVPCVVDLASASLQSRCHSKTAPRPTLPMALVSVARRRDIRIVRGSLRRPSWRARHQSESRQRTTLDLRTGTAAHGEARDHPIRRQPGRSWLARSRIPGGATGKTKLFAVL